MSGQVDDYELIKLIETYPILYDKTSARGTKNATRKDEAWKEISVKMNASERACITRWKSIRDRFGKEFRRLQENPDETMYWEMFQHLLFLKDHYKHGQVKSEALDSIKFEPKDRRRKTRQRWGDGGGVVKKVDEEDPEVDPHNVELTQHLIALVKEYPVLYDRHKIRDSKNIAAKNEAWRAISESLGEPEESLYKRWKKLRDRFAREYRNHHINSEVPISWIYFEDLLFLESHYRKGIPLVVENLKRRGRPRKHFLRRPVSETSVGIDDNAWGGEYPYSSEDDDQRDEGQSGSVTGQELLHYEETEDETIEIVPEPEHEEKYIEVKTHSLDNVILVPPDQIPIESSQLANYSVSSVDVKKPLPSTSCQQPEEEEEEPAQKLTHVISNIECVLRQTQDCLKSLHEQQQRHQMELQATASASAENTHVVGYQPQASVIAKTQMLLDGLTLEQRLCAERKIIKFLCECQIKELNDEEIEDLLNVHIY